MNLSVQSVFKSTFAVAALTLASGAAMAGAVTVQPSTTWQNSDNVISYAGESISASNVSGGSTLSNQAKSYTGNSALDYAAWGMHGRWLTFALDVAATTTITVGADDASAMSPGFTVYATNGWFDGGLGGTGETSSTGTGTPHSFNQTGQAGDYGTYWMTDASIANGNAANGILETLGYANSGPGRTSNGWGGEVLQGAYDLTVTDNFTSGVSGSVGQGFASLTLLDLQPGMYAMFFGGADGSLAGSSMSVNVSSVPVPAAVWLFGSALVGLIGSARRKATA